MNFFKIIFLCILFSFSPLLGKQEKEPQQIDNKPIITSSQRWGLQKFAALGYRRDRQSFSQLSLADAQRFFSETHIEARDTLQLTLGSFFEIYGAVFDFKAAYGWLLRGRGEQIFPGDGTVQPVTFVPFDIAAGYTADAEISWGFKLRFIDRSSFALTLSPSGGYSYSHLQNGIEGIGTENYIRPFVGLSNSVEGFSRFSFPHPQTQDWYGPFAEALLQMRLEHQLDIKLFYQHHWPSLRMKMVGEFDNYVLSSPGVFSSVTLERLDTRIDGRGLSRNVWGADLHYHREKGWSTGLHFEGAKTVSSNCLLKGTRTQVQQVVSGAVGPVHLETRAFVKWVMYSVYLFANYGF